MPVVRKCVSRALRSTESGLLKKVHAKVKMLYLLWYWELVVQISAVFSENTTLYLPQHTGPLSHCESMFSKHINLLILVQIQRKWKFRTWKYEIWNLFQNTSQGTTNCFWTFPGSKIDGTTFFVKSTIFNIPWFYLSQRSGDTFPYYGHLSTHILVLMLWLTTYNSALSRTVID